MDAGPVGTADQPPPHGSEPARCQPKVPLETVWPRRAAAAVCQPHSGSKPRKRSETPSFRSRSRGIALAALLFLLATAGWRTAQLDGLLRPIRVSGPSMSPTLWGPTRQARCPRCDLSYRVHAPHGSRAPSTPAARCMGCGRMGLEISERTTAGDRVIIDRGAYRWLTPRRDDLVAIRTGDGGLQVKRVVGVPGEVLRIGHRGNLSVDGQPLRPSPEQSWRRSVVVHDHSHRDGAESRWRQSDDGGWRIYHHLDVHAATDCSGGGQPACIRDDNPANISLTRATFPVDDLQLSMRVRAERPCRLELVFAAGERPLTGSLEVDAGQHRIRVTKIGDALWQLRTGDPPRRIDAPPPAPGDRPHPAVDALRPVALRVVGDGAPRIDRLWLGRSVRYDPPRQYAELWARGVRVAADRYLVIGDNPPASEDSRQAPGGVPRSAIIGRVIPWPL